MGGDARTTVEAGGPGSPSLSEGAGSCGCQGIVTSYCQPCAAVVCGKCKVEHSSSAHRLITLPEATGLAIDEVEIAIQGQVSERILEYEDACDKVRERMAQVESQRAHLAAEIERDFAVLMQAVEKRRRELRSVLQTTANSKLRHLKDQEAELENMACSLRTTAEQAAATIHEGRSDTMKTIVKCKQLRRELLFASSQGLDSWSGPVEQANLSLDLNHGVSGDLALMIRSKGWVGETEGGPNCGEDEGPSAPVNLSQRGSSSSSSSSSSGSRSLMKGVKNMFYRQSSVGSSS